MKKPSNFYESYQRPERVKGPSERAFGLTVGGILAAIGVVAWFAGKSAIAAYVLWGVGGSLVLAAFAWPPILKPLNRVWLKLGLIGFRVINPVVLALIFFLTIVPIGLLMRLLGKRPLSLRYERGAASYWIKRGPGSTHDSMKHQF